MAKIRNKDFNIQTSNVSSVTVVLPPHVTGDLLLVFAGKDDATGTDPTTATSGWTRGGSGVSAGSTTAAVRCAWFYKVAASADEPDLVITSSDSDTWSIIAMSIEGAHATPIDASSGNGSTDATGAPFAVTGVTTNYANSLVIYACFSGGTGAPGIYPGLQLIDAVDSAAEGACCAYTVQAATGATGSANFYTDATNTNTLGFCVAVRDDGNGKIPAYWDRDYATMIHPFRGSAAIITGDVWGTALTNYKSLGKAPVGAFIQVDQSGGPSYVDFTTAANNGTDGDIDPHPNPAAAGADGTGDWFAVGYHKPFSALVFDRAGGTAAGSSTIVYEYWNGSAWAALANPVDPTNSFTATVVDNDVVTWTIPANFNWTPTSINGSASLYFVRGRLALIYTTYPKLSQVYIGGRPLVYDAVGSAADAGVIQFENASTITPAVSPGIIGGTYIDLGQTVSLTNKIICGTYQFSLPRDYVDLARFKEGGGLVLFFADTSFNRRAWCVGSFRDDGTSDAQRNRFAIDWEQTVDTTIIDTTTAPSDTIADVFIGGLFPRGAGSFAMSHMIAVEPLNAVVNGGSSTVPISLVEFRALGNASPVQLFRDDILMVPVTFGGTDDVAISLDQFTFTFPGVATPWTDPYNPSPRCQAHYDTGVLGFTINAQSGDVVKLTNGKITSASQWKFDILSSASASATYDFTGLLLINALVTLRAVHTFTEMQFQDCTITQNSAVIDACSFKNTKINSATPAAAALITDSAFTSGGTGHAIEISGTVANITLTDLLFTGYSGTSTDAAIYVNIASGTMTISVSGGDIPSIRTAGATVNVVNAKTALVTVKAAATSAAIQNARVLLLADTGGPLPFEETVTIVNSGTTATVAHTAHGLTTGQKVQIKGASHAANNGVFTVTVTNANEYTYTMGSTPGSSPTGTIEATGVILEGLTNASGIIQNTAFPYTSSQPVVGRARKGTSAPFYKTGAISGTLGATGFDTTVFLVLDE